MASAQCATNQTAANQTLPWIDQPTAKHHGDRLDRDLLALYEQLLATRFDLASGAGPSDGQLTLSRGEFDCVLAQLDSAIVATRSMVSAVVPVPGAAPGFDIQAAYGAAGHR